MKPVARAKFAAKTFDVMLHRDLAERQRFGDVAVTQPTAQTDKHIMFTPRQVDRQRRRGGHHVDGDVAFTGDEQTKRPQISVRAEIIGQKPGRAGGRETGNRHIVRP